MPASTACESCLMPLTKDPGTRESDRYCSYCFRNGKLCYEGSDLKEFKQICHAAMRKKGIGPLKAAFFTFCIGFAPRWRGKRVR